MFYHILFLPIKIGTGESNIYSNFLGTLNINGWGQLKDFMQDKNVKLL